LFLGQYFGIQYSGLKALVIRLMHALRAIGEPRCRARVSAESHANIICSAQCPIVVIFTLRRIGESITVAAQKIGASSMELRYPAVARNPIDNARTDEIRPGTAESARHPDDRGWLFDVLPFSPVPPDPIRQY